MFDGRVWVVAGSRRGERPPRRARDLGAAAVRRTRARHPGAPRRDLRSRDRRSRPRHAGETSHGGATGQLLRACTRTRPASA